MTDDAISGDDIRQAMLETGNYDQLNEEYELVEQWTGATTNGEIECPISGCLDRVLFKKVPRHIRLEH